MSNFFKSNRKIGVKASSSRFPSIKFYFSAGEAKPAPPLGPVIAMFQLNMAQVCKELNELSSNYPAGLPIAATVYRVGPKLHRIVLGKPTLKTLLESFLSYQIPESLFQDLQKPDADDANFSVPDTLSMEQLYDLVRIHAFHTGVSLASVAPTVFSTLKSMHRFPLKKISL
jgi:ribosomal protein L11